MESQSRRVSKYTLLQSVFIHQINLFNFFLLYLMRVIVKIIKDILQEENKTENSLENIYYAIN